MGIDHQGKKGGEASNILQENNDHVYQRVREFGGGARIGFLVS